MKNLLKKMRKALGVLFTILLMVPFGFWRLLCMCFDKDD